MVAFNVLRVMFMVGFKAKIRQHEIFDIQVGGYVFRDLKVTGELNGMIEYTSCPLSDNPGTLIITNDCQLDYTCNIFSGKCEAGTVLCGTGVLIAAVKNIYEGKEPSSLIERAEPAHTAVHEPRRKKAT